MKSFFFFGQIRWLFLGLIIFLSACATPSARLGQQPYADNYIELTKFCAKHNAAYFFDTIDDTVKITLANKEIRGILYSPVAYFNGKIFTLNRPFYYSQGKIYLPKELENVLISGQVPAFKPTYFIKTIVIDPGHGGHDAGAISNGVKEKNLNLKISNLIKDELEKKGYSVLLTRNRDVYLTLQQRVDFAKKHNADLFLCVHANASSKSRATNGMEIYYLHPSRLNASQRAKTLAQTEDMWPQVDGLDAKAVLWDMTLTKNYALSVETGNIMFNTFKNLGFNIKPPRKAPFYVLRFAYVPAVLLEVGYLTNKYEAKVLQKDSYQQQIAQAIVMGVDNLSQRYAQLAKSKR